jgi:glycosyltransferase involved in cell wall biosynthesis
MTSSSLLRIAINSNVTPGVAGGVTQSTVGLIHALGQLDNGPEQYVLIVGSHEQQDWLKPYCGANQQIVVKSGKSGTNGAPNGRLSATGVLKRALWPVLPAARYVQHLLHIPEVRQWPEVQVSDGFMESLGCDVVHFPTQSYTLCALPTIYNPHDLQHLHYPQFFTPAELACREKVYRTACQLSHCIVVGTQWIRNDVVRQMGVHPDKVQIIPWAPPTQFYSQPSQNLLSTVPRKYDLQAPFALYPAVTWPHKNHLRLLEAIAQLRDERGLIVRLVCTGSLYDPFQPRIDQRVRELNLASQVKFLGFVPEEELRALYRLAHFLVLPTLYEADSCPIHEAWSEGLPVASSNATALPDQVLDAGLLFDPKDVDSIAEALRRMATEDDLRANLRRLGYRRVMDFSWERTAKAYRAVYRRAANISLSEEDRWLLEWDWMREPEKAMEVVEA